ncbi:hypothetical protein ACFQGE_17510 [Halomicroarcula sp. GCM10025817]|uniref:hypothetical protein n=1 Tax=Halomicroarcula sp. GCM10025817 TaxID=3252672 RepID=UPI003605B6D1
MYDDADGSDHTTRRSSLQYGGALLAGCSSDDGADGSRYTTAEPSTDTPTATATPEQIASADGEATESRGDSYAVEMAPAGRVEFDAPPETVTHYFPD